MTNIFNNLTKLSPPPFVTTSASNKRLVIKCWSNVVVNSNYKTLKDLLDAEINLLSGYIERKGTQLRLEKALMLTKQIQKVALRWTNNDFYNQLNQFQRSIGYYDTKTGCIRHEESRQNSNRSPSRQWSNWIIYLALRDSALLAKINVECAHTIKFWLGLIASAHHWGDSLVICSILARIWFLSSKLLDDFINTIYPSLRQISKSLSPNNSAKWPDSEFKSPPDLLKWIQHILKLPFVPIDPYMNFRFPTQNDKAKEKQDNLLFLETFFIDTRGDPSLHPEGKVDNKDDEEEEDNENSVDENHNEPEVIEIVENETKVNVKKKNKNKTHSAKLCKRIEKVPLVQQKKEPNSEDLGMVIDRSIVQKKKNQNKKKGKLRNDNKLSETFFTWKEMKTHWRKFFVNVPEKLETEDGRKKLCIQIKKYLKVEKEHKIQIKLKRLRKLVRNTIDHDDESTLASLLGFNKLQKFTTKHVKQLKKTSMKTTIESKDE